MVEYVYIIYIIGIYRGYSGGVGETARYERYGGIPFKINNLAYLLLYLLCLASRVKGKLSGKNRY